MKSPVVLLWNLLHDLKRLHPEVEGLDRDFHTAQIRFKHEGLSFLTRTLPTLGEAIIHGLSVGKLTCPRNFKKVPRGAIPRFLSGMLCRVFDLRTGLLISDAYTDHIISLIQVCMLYKKCIYSEASEERLEAEAVDAFYAVEDNIAEVLPDDITHQLHIMSQLVMPNLERALDMIEPKHGPGAVYEGYRGNRKWSALWESVEKHDSLARYGFDTINILDRGILSEPLRADSIEAYSVPSTHTPENPSSSARLVTVPKNSTSRRTITVEPMLNQFVQQGLNTALRDAISQCGILRQCLALTDQRLNNNLALKGSLTGEYATLDLKSASDLLSTKLVETCFYSKKEFLGHVMECRSSEVEYKGVRRPIRKFAGMGNALTFPVQSICFAMISMASILSSVGRKPTYRSVKWAARQIRVYGDDIIVRTEFAPQVMSGLQRVGLIVNTSKSFTVGRYRESCGTDYYAGELVTPVYVRCLPESDLRKADVLGKLVAASNQFWLKGYYSTATYLADSCEAILGRRIPLMRNAPLEYDQASVYQAPVHLGFATRQGWGEIHGWNSLYQSPAVKGPVIRSLSESSALDGVGALLKFFFTPLLGRGKGHLSRSPLRYHTKVSVRWMQA